MKKVCFMVVIMVLVMGTFPITSQAQERMPINDVILSDNPETALGERDLVSALLEVNIQKCKNLEQWDFLHHNQEWLEEVQSSTDYPVEELFEKMKLVTNQLLLWQRLELQSYTFLDDESLEMVVEESNQAYEIVYQIQRALGISAEYLSAEQF
ncbi:MAG: hypothetical protein ACLS95_01305 [Clostridia bacterium]